LHYFSHSSVNPEILLQTSKLFLNVLDLLNVTSSSSQRHRRKQTTDVAERTIKCSLRNLLSQASKYIYGILQNAGCRAGSAIATPKSKTPSILSKNTINKIIESIYLRLISLKLTWNRLLVLNPAKTSKPGKLVTKKLYKQSSLSI
jgi:hypothetical protein